MLKTLLEENIKVVDAQKNDLNLFYYITKKPCNNKNSDFIYGILIKKYTNSNATNSYEEDYVYNITYSYKEIKRIVKLLAKNNVTPITLVNILDDLHDEISLESEIVLVNN